MACSHMILNSPTIYVYKVLGIVLQASDYIYINVIGIKFSWEIYTQTHSLQNKTAHSLKNPNMSNLFCIACPILM